jgi:ketosteroid isomerase-like protein
MLVCGAAAHAATDEQAVTAAEQQWLKSQQTNNTQLLAPLLHDKVVETTAEGMFVGKSAVLADAKSTTWSSADYTDMNVTVVGNTAIATGVFVGKGKNATGKAVDTRVRFTDTWVKGTDGKWLCIASHDSPVTT